MGKKKIKELVPELLGSFLESSGLELFNAEFVREGRERFLRVCIDKPQKADGSDDYVSIEECEKVSRYLSERLDELEGDDDPMKESYTLEVSSPGLDRPLIRDKDFERYAGRLVDVSMYSPCEEADGQKQLTAILEGLFGDVVRLRIEEPEGTAHIADIQRDRIAKISLAVVF